MHTVNLLIKLVEHHQILAYAIIFLGLIFEGEVVVISTGILAHLGALNFYFALLFILLGGFTKTFLGYYVGQIIYKKWYKTKIMRFFEKRVRNILPRFKQKPFWSVFISKFIMGANYIVMIFAGFSKIDFKKYLKAEFFSTIVWAPSLLCLGFFFSYTALRYSREISKFSLIILFLIISFIIFDKLITWVYEVFEEFYEKEE